MVLRLLEYNTYNTYYNNIRVKFELKNREKSSIYYRVKLPINLNTVVELSAIFSGVRKNLFTQFNSVLHPKL